MPDFEELIRHGREERHLEYKQSGSWSVLQIAIAKTSLGMANLRDGGTIVVGVREADHLRFELTGVSEDHADTFKEDEIREYINRFAVPPVAVTVTRYEVDGMTFVVIAVEEFESLPVICARDGGPKSELRAGAVYIRPMSKIETREIRTAEEMRAIIDMSTEKRLAELLGTVGRAGGRIQAATNDSELFEAELRGL
jgi:predicted HTH transcriptional regulator